MNLLQVLIWDQKGKIRMDIVIVGANNILLPIVAMNVHVIKTDHIKKDHLFVDGTRDHPDGVYLLEITAEGLIEVQEEVVTLPEVAKAQSRVHVGERVQEVMIMQEETVIHQTVDRAVNVNKIYLRNCCF